MVRTTHHGDPPMPFANGGTQQAAHRRFPTVVLHNVGMAAGPVVGRPDLRDGLGQRREPLDGVCIRLLDGVLPPPLRIGVAGGAGQHPNRIGAVRLLHRGGRFGAIHGGIAVVGGCCWPVRRGSHAEGEGVRRGQVDRPHLGAGGKRPAKRHPLRREARHRVKGSEPRLIGCVDQPGDGRRHLRIGQQRNHLVKFRGTFNQHQIRPEGCQRLGDRMRRTGAVMPDPQDVDVCHRSVR